MTLLAPGTRRAARPAPSEPAAPRLTLGSPTGGSEPEQPPLRLVGAIAVAVLLMLAVVVQRTALPLLPAGPADLVTVMVVTLGLSFGPAAGCLAGFGSGLLADALSDHSLGRLAAVLCVVGYLAGLVPAVRSRRLRYALPLIALGCAVVPLLFALTGVLVSDTRAAGSLLASRCAAGAVYGLLFGLVLHPLLPRLLTLRSRVRSRARRRVTG